MELKDHSKLSDQDYNYLKELDDSYLMKLKKNETFEDKKYTDEDYKKLQENLILYKQGSREATEYIISAFHNILHMYAHFIVLHTIPKKPYYNSQKKKECQRIYPSVLNFIKLFNATKEGETNGITYIQGLFSKYEYGDIYNTLVLALLNMANKYKIITDENDPKYRRNGTFHNYVDKCFHFEAFRFLSELTKDPLIFNSGIRRSKLLYLDEELDTEYESDYNIQSEKFLVDKKAVEDIEFVIDYVDREIEISKLPITMKENIDLYDENSLNFNWINGAVSNPAFTVLNNYERELLILYFVKDKTYQNLSDLYGCSMQTITTHIKKAVEKLKDALKFQEKGD